MTSTKIEFDLDPYLEMITLSNISNATNFQASIIKVNNLVVNGCTYLKKFTHSLKDTFHLNVSSDLTAPKMQCFFSAVRNILHIFTKILKG